MISHYIKLIRPHQWVKNLFCFAGMIFGQHYSLYYLKLSMLAFLAFSLAASSIYILNDILDRESDRNHPTKCHRPIASVKVSIKIAILLAMLFTLSAFCISFIISPWATCLIMIYLIINILYSLKLKHIVILDVFIISFGFLLRLLMGTSGIGIPNSEWIILCTIMITLFLGFSKRRADLLDCEISHVSAKARRVVLEKYEPRMLDIFIAMTGGCSILSYALFVVLSGKPMKLIYTTVFVAYGIMYYIFKLYRNNGGHDTASDLIDFNLIITVILWVSVYLFFLNVK